VDLDLGAVYNVAEVRVNGKDAGTHLLRPYRADITSLLQPGENDLEIAVTNLLANQLPGEGRKLGVIFNFPVHPPTLEPSGMVGPVRLLARARTSR